MGVDLARIVVWKESDLKGLGGKLLALDGHNALYQFLAIIRDSRGRPLRDRDRRVTSHLSGLLYRNVNLLEAGIGLVFVFDGKPPLLKGKELQRRRRFKEESRKRYKKALAEGRFAEARRAASAAASLEEYMLEDATR
ncbi:MAG: flap structure-specific endonuclease, partial [Candidatus Geothermarchaeales archaeon]